MKLPHKRVAPPKNVSVQEFQRVFFDSAIEAIQDAVYGTLTGGAPREEFTLTERKRLRRILHWIVREAR